MWAKLLLLGGGALAFFCAHLLQRFYMPARDRVFVIINLGDVAESTTFICCPRPFVVTFRSSATTALKTASRCRRLGTKVRSGCATGATPNTGGGQAINERQCTMATRTDWADRTARWPQVCVCAGHPTPSIIIGRAIATHE